MAPPGPPKFEGLGSAALVMTPPARCTAGAYKSYAGSTMMTSSPGNTSACIDANSNEDAPAPMVTSESGLYNAPCS